MTAFQKLAHFGGDAIPVLVDALKNGEPETRVFAAQALGFLVDASAKPALEAALADKTPAVRLYALDAMSQFGKLNRTDVIQSIQDKDTNRDVKAHVGFAVDRDDNPTPEAIRDLLANYDLTKMNTAMVGQAAPDFELTDAMGKKSRLSEFQGKMNVVLVFVYGDT